MKKILLSALMIGAIAVGCKKDDAAPGIDAAQIVGKWKFNKIEGKITTAIPGFGSSDSTYTKNQDTASYFDFKASKKLYTYTKSSSGFVLDSATYSISGNKLYTEAGTGKDTLTIETLTANNLLLSQTGVVNFIATITTTEKWSFTK